MTQANTPSNPVTKFTGINNKADPQTLGFGGFVVADNVNIDSSGAHVFARVGQESLSTTPYPNGAYATLDAKRCYAVDGDGNLVLWNGSASALRTGFVGYPYWCQIANIVFVGNENQTWRIGPDNVVSDNALEQPQPLALTPVAGTLPPGQYRFVQVSVTPRESAPSIESIITVDGTQNIQVSGITGQRIYVAPADSMVFQRWCDTAESVLVYAQTAETLGEELRTNNLQPMPDGRCLTQHEGRLYCSLYDAASDQSAIFRSSAYWWDLCDLTDFYIVPGEVRAMYGLPEGLVVGTDREIGAITEEGWNSFADYGVPPGQCIAPDVKIAGQPAKQCWIWTQRGLCKAWPLVEVTPQFAPPVADFVGAAVIRANGDERFVATLSPFDTPDNEN